MEAPILSGQAIHYKNNNTSTNIDSAPSINVEIKTEYKIQIQAVQIHITNGNIK